MGFFTGSKGKFSQRSVLGPEQQGLYNQLLKASQGKSNKGSFGQAGQYYRDLLSNDNDTYNAFQAPELRRFREETIPELSEQFAGMGSGGLSSSGFRNAAVNAGVDLSERLGAIRAQLRQQGAQGLMGIGQQGLGQYNENTYIPGQPGFLQSLFGGAGQAAGMVGGSYLGSKFPSFGGQSQPQSNPTSFNAPSMVNPPKGVTSPYGNSNFQLPNFGAAAPNNFYAPVR